MRQPVAMRTVDSTWEKAGWIVNELAMTLLAQHQSEELIAAAERSARAARVARTGQRLTRREREVAVLAAGGLSNREIAELLVVSVRTIENQLYRVYAKLGVTGRHRLGAVLGNSAGHQ